MPEPTVRADREVDPTVIQVVGNLLRTIANEVDVDLVRAAYSPVIKESFDCSAAILGADGTCWAQADAIPLQMGVLRTVLREVQASGLDDLEHGDVVVTNDPSREVPHLNDVVALSPVIVGGRTIAYIAALMHHTDVGGMSPGSMPADATEMFQEGIRIPPRRIVSGGELDQSFLELMLANTRMPSNLRGDLEAQLSACQRGVERILEAVGRFGADRFVALVERFLDYTESLVRHRLAELEAGSYSAERFADGSSGGTDPIRVYADVTVAPDGVAIDFSGSADQVPRPINAVLSNAEAAATVAVRAVLGKDLPVNDGLDRLIEVRCRKGAVLNPVIPAPVGARAQVSILAYECVLDCLGDSAPERAVASSSGGTTMPFTWMPTAGQRAGDVLVDNSLTGGMGGSASGPGLPVTDNSVTNAMNYPAELVEQDFPVRVECCSIRPGSGGEGRYRGGDGMRREIRFLDQGLLSLRGHRHQFPPPGLNGGLPGSPTRFRLVRSGEVIELEPDASRIETRPGDLLVAETPGGGGYGAAEGQDRRASGEEGGRDDGDR